MLTLKSRTDLSIAALGPVPDVSAGVNTLVTDPAFGAEIVRVTSPLSNPKGLSHLSFFAGLGGSSFVNPFNRKSTKVLYEDQGTRQYVVNFDPVSMKVSPLYPDQFGITFKVPGGGACEFSHTVDDLIYQYLGSRIMAWDVSKPTPPSIVTAPLIADFSHILPQGYNVTWQAVGGSSHDDRTFVMAFSNNPGGGQGTGSKIVVYRVGKGYRIFDTMNGTVNGEWGINGTIQSSLRCLIHNVKVSPNGQWLVLATSLVESGLKVKHIWNIASLQLQEVLNSDGGHWVCGPNSYINNGGMPFGQWSKRPWTSPTLPLPIIAKASMPKNLKPKLDAHASWNSVSIAETEPFFVTTTHPCESDTDPQYVGPWYNEALIIYQGMAYRLCRTYNSGNSPMFSGIQATGCDTQSNDPNLKFSIFCSDWMNTLEDKRVDTFIVKWR